MFPTPISRKLKLSPRELESHLSILSVLLAGGSPVDIDSSVFVQAVLFVIAYFVLKFLLFDPLMKLFDAREEAVNGAKRDAKGVHSDAEAKQTEYNDRMRDMRAEANAEREQLRADGLSTEASILSRVKVDTAKQLQDAESQMNQQAAQVRAELKNTVDALANDIAGKLLGRGV